jgi:hypothetical protein
MEIVTMVPLPLWADGSAADLRSIGEETTKNFSQVIEGLNFGELVDPKNAKVYGAKFSALYERYEKEGTV